MSSSPTVSRSLMTLLVNGDHHSLAVPHHYTLLELLRYQLGLTGSKQGCDKGDCGACTVMIGGEAQLSCLLLAQDCVGHEITTIEGLVTPEGLDPVQQAFDQAGALQCGFCQPGMMITARCLLDEVADPTREEIDDALGGNLCRCTGYTKIIDAVELAGRLERLERQKPLMSPHKTPLTAGTKTNAQNLNNTKRSESAGTNHG